MKVSVVVTAYNHERYITPCLESILLQKGDFQMEIIMGDDASTDKTRVIAEQFQAQHPGLFFHSRPEKTWGSRKTSNVAWSPVQVVT